MYELLTGVLIGATLSLLLCLVWCSSECVLDPNKRMTCCNLPSENCICTF